MLYPKYTSNIYIYTQLKLPKPDMIGGDYGRSVETTESSQKQD